MNITVMYTCKTCFLTKVKLDVPARGEESVTDWMKATMKLVGQDHARLMPTCPGETCDLMIPVTAANKVGGPAVQ